MNTQGSSETPLSSPPGSVPWSLLISLLFPSGLVSTVTGWLGPFTFTWIRLQLYNQPGGTSTGHRCPTEGTAAQPHGRVLPATEPSSDWHNCSKSLQQVPGVAKLFIRRTEQVPLSDAWCQPGPSAFCRGVSVLACPPTAWQYFKAGGKITQS